MGTDLKGIRKIFLYEGWLISGIGALGGLVLGILVCWAQQSLKLIKLQGSGSFVIDAYPVQMEMNDF